MALALRVGVPLKDMEMMQVPPDDAVADGRR
jgi:succinate dehydrogenase/fumarate reductase flavoprotein subunit